MDLPDKPAVGRRDFLKGVATGALAAAPIGGVPVGAAQPAAAQQTQAPQPQSAAAVADSRPKQYASDFMVDLFRSMNMEYMFAMCASSFIGIHESVINYAGNRNPESITCTHEEISVAMANGYAKIEGKPVLVCVHGTVGTQHAAMAIYDAWCDRVPIYLVLGNTQDATERTGEVFWVHSAQDPAAIIRDMTKWDDNPVSLGHFAESAARASLVPSEVVSGYCLRFRGGGRETATRPTPPTTTAKGDFPCCAGPAPRMNCTCSKACVSAAQVWLSLLTLPSR